MRSLGEQSAKCSFTALPPLPVIIRYRNPASHTSLITMSGFVATIVYENGLTKRFNLCLRGGGRVNSA